MVEEDVSLTIDEIKQKTFLEINEKGIEAVASTSIAIEKSSAPVNKKPFNMKGNRPFAIAITDQQTDAILFLGSIQQPLEDNNP